MDSRKIAVTFLLMLFLGSSVMLAVAPSIPKTSAVSCSSLGLDGTGSNTYITGASTAISLSTTCTNDLLRGQEPQRLGGDLN